MNIQNKVKNPNSSEDLTVVLLKGNSSPRSFRIPLPRLYRSLTFIGFTFFTSLLLSGVFVLYLSYQSWNYEKLDDLSPQQPSQIEVDPPIVKAPEPAATPTEPPAQSTLTATVTFTTTTTATTTQTVTNTINSNEEATPSLWSRIAGSFSKSGDTPSSASEIEKEVVSLREQVAAQNNKADGRAELKSGDGPISLLPSRSSLLTKAENVVEVKNVKVVTESGKTTLKFELHNTDIRNKQVRGYIVAMAKSNDALFVYPPGAFAPKDNILVNYTKGETFAVSRFREAIATFPDAVTDKGFQFQILLFRSDGKMISHQHVEKK